MSIKGAGGALKPTAAAIGERHNGHEPLDIDTEAEWAHKLRYQTRPLKDAHAPIKHVVGNVRATKPV